jgi:hypothetical protein
LPADRNTSYPWFLSLSFTAFSISYPLPEFPRPIVCLRI